MQTKMLTTRDWLMIAGATLALALVVVYGVRLVLAFVLAVEYSCG